MAQDRVGSLLAAGFSPDEVGAWSTQQRATLGAAGFSEPEINDYIGGQPKPVPQPFIERIARALRTPPPQEYPGLGQFVSGIGKGIWLPGESLREQLPGMPSAEQIGAALGRIPGGMLVDPIRQGAQSLEAAVKGEPVSAQEMLSAGMLAAGGTGQSAIMRYSRGPMGEPHGMPIGDLPKAESFSDATRAIVGDTPAPQAYTKLDRLWEENGIHPAEVAHDAASDVTITQDLAAAGNKLPEAYVKPLETPAAKRPPAPIWSLELAHAHSDIESEFRILRDGDHVGNVHITKAEDGASANVDMISTDISRQWNVMDGQPNILGPSAMRRIAQQYFEANPDVQVLTGERVTGAKTTGGDSPPVPAGITREQVGMPPKATAGAPPPRDYMADYEANQRAAELNQEESSIRSQPANHDTYSDAQMARLAQIRDERAALAPPDGTTLTFEPGTPAEPRPTTGEIVPPQSHEMTPQQLIDRARISEDTNILGERKLPPGATEAEFVDLGPPASIADLRQRQAQAITELAPRRILGDLLRDEGGGTPPPKPPPEPPTGPPESVPDAQSRILGHLSVGEPDVGRGWSWSRVYSSIVDRLNPLNDAVKEATGGEKLATAEDPYQLARLYAGVSGKADQWLNRSTFDFNSYADTGKSLKAILEPVGRNLDDFRAFVSSQRAIELEGRGIKTGMDIDAARMVAEAGAERFSPIMTELVDYQNKLGGYLRDAGILSKDGLAAMRAENPLYVPFQRVFGDVLGDVVPDVVRGQGASLQASNPIHAIKGSERVVIDPLESIVRNTYLSLAAAEKNAVGTKLVDLIQRAGNLPVPRHADEISIYRNGAKESHTVSAELAAAMKGLDEESANTMLRMMSAPARMLRAGATLSPDFMLRNPIRDFFSAVINTTKGVFSPIDTIKGLMGAIHKDADFSEWMKGGGANSMLVSLDRRYLQQNLAQLTAETGLASRSWNVVRHPIDTLRTISQLTEEATRLGEFKGARRQALAAGATPKEAAQAAAYASREVSIDFARRGSMTRSMNMITAFWNAQVQGIDRLARAFRDDPGGTTLKIAAGITAPSVLLWWANHQDPRWQEIPAWERDMFWLIMTKEHIYRIPKPFEVGVMFGSGPERLLDAFVAQRPDAFKDLSKSIMSALLPGAIPTFALPVVEQWANRSSFTDRPLIPQSMEKHLPEYEYTPYTTETTKALGKILGAFPGIKDVKLGSGPGAGVARALSTPILMENYLQAWTGGLGKYALQIADASLRKAGVVPDPVKPSDTLADMPVIKAFVVRYPSSGTESIQRFFDNYDEKKVYLDTWKAMAKEGNIEAMKHIQEMGGMGMFVQLDRIKLALATQAQLVRNVYKNPTNTPDEKRQLIDSAYNSMITIARSGVDTMRRADAALAARRQ